MTVNELIEQLRDYPPDMRVVVNGYEGGENGSAGFFLLTILQDIVEYNHESFS